MPHSTLLRPLAMSAALVLLSCGGGGSSGDTNPNVPDDGTPEPPLVTCTGEPIPTGSPWHVQAGFPACYDSGAGFFPEGPQHGITLGNVDQDAQQEILVAATATIDRQSLFIFEHTGALTPNWPPANLPKGTAPFVLVRTGSTSSAAAIFSGTNTVNYTTSQNYLSLATLQDGLLPGWPRVAANYVGAYPASYDVDGDGIDEIFTDEEDHSLHAYRISGEPLPGWPSDKFHCGGGTRQQVVSIRFGDIDGDGDAEAVAVMRPQFAGVTICLAAFHLDGSTVSGFPVAIPATDAPPTIALGDVDADGTMEIVYVVDHHPTGDYSEPPAVLIISAEGALKLSIPLPGQILYGAPAPVLADLDGDGTPEIIVLMEGKLQVVRGSGETVPGFPVAFSEHTSGGSTPSLSNCGVVVGDIDGDLLPEILFCDRTATGRSELWAFSSGGSLLAGSPLVLETSGAEARGPAIGDIDLDGQNEVVVGTTEKLWSLKYGDSKPSGEILWSQWNHR